MSRRWSRTRTARSSGRTKPVFAQHWRKWWKIRTCEPILVLRTGAPPANGSTNLRSEEHTSELQSLMRISYAVFCLKKKKKHEKTKNNTQSIYYITTSNTKPLNQSTRN